ncbi:gamma-glutamyl-gamma-aminobutyrate hydrolase family protein [Cryobacterium tagatosivorans]|uniref:Gamma-glutamyl-gamma-aminobutyrate hydrolase family protein n=1 Tax=Cryobacterium tagatosivorans TaxID=1259199 RepID=A0A4R8UGP0_9MICO|nr:gamma-glutamyl-gamma-aminobutyrate hydrolase family protein [Cryobacterium tagatosivorans]TFB54773.1 gamma-glutamyl-gamma-aminobutyrate hydrolase family protein [Cryobacterium tagatosivorans]
MPQTPPVSTAALPPGRRRILASYSQDAEQASAWLRETLHTFARSAADALEQAGAEVVFVDAGRSADDPVALVASFDGVLVLGGGDLDPAAFGQPPLAGKLYGVDPRADAFELALANAAIDGGVPFLGLCRGMQVLNVARGGDLVQDLGPGTIHNVESSTSTMTGHDVRVLPGTLLAAVYDRERLDIRSGHHQAVGGLGAGLRISADAADGTTEAIEGYADAGGWTLGVQWHPEDPDADPAQLATLMAAFAAACA